MKIKLLLSTCLLVTSLFSNNIVASDQIVYPQLEDGHIESNMIETSLDSINETLQIVNKKYTAYTTSSVNLRKEPSTNSAVIKVLPFNKKIEYVTITNKWAKVKCNNSYAYVCAKYISKHKCKYKEYQLPKTSGFKSFMGYKAITSVTSPQYKLQKKAYTGSYGIRQVDGRYCVAVGSHFTNTIGTKFDLVLENETVIPCILSDQKADKDTDVNNIVTVHNGCVSEFIVDVPNLDKNIKRMGDVSYGDPNWKSPVAKIRVYK